MTAEEAREVYSSIVDYIMESDDVSPDWTIIVPWMNIVDHDDIIDNPFDKYINRMFHGCYNDSGVSICTIFYRGVYTNLVSSYYNNVSFHYGFFDNSGNFVVEEDLENDNTREIFRERDYGTKFINIDKSDLEFLPKNEIEVYYDKEHNMYFIPEDLYDETLSEML